MYNYIKRISKWNDQQKIKIYNLWPRCIKVVFDHKSKKKSNIRWFATNQNRAFRTYDWFFRLLIQHNIYSMGPKLTIRQYTPHEWNFKLLVFRYTLLFCHSLYWRYLYIDIFSSGIILFKIGVSFYWDSF